jgi:hypothetical protein
LQAELVDETLAVRETLRLFRCRSYDLQRESPRYALAQQRGRFDELDDAFGR